MHSRTENVTKLKTDVALDIVAEIKILSQEITKTCKMALSGRIRSLKDIYFGFLEYSSICATPGKASWDSLYKTQMDEEKKARQKLYKMSDVSQDFSFW